MSYAQVVCFSCPTSQFIAQMLSNRRKCAHVQVDTIKAQSHTYRLARAINIRCIYDIFGREITKYMVIYSVYIHSSGHFYTYIYTTLHAQPYTPVLYTPTEPSRHCTSHMCGPAERTSSPSMVAFSEPSSTAPEVYARCTSMPGAALASVTGTPWAWRGIM
jgi:hypothetical protein